ncbi:MAG: recombination protein RecR [Pseudomonadota bacterium]|jgi:recombination protein RecR
MQHTPALAALIEALRTLPGVGPKSAQRMAFHLLQQARPAAQNLGLTLQRALERVGSCRRCRMFSEGELCVVCANTQRDDGLLCVVESPADVVAIEQTSSYRGRYFVLMGHLSPLDGVGPEQLGAQQLDDRLAAGGVREVIIATNSTVEGEATAHFLSQLVHAHGIGASRIAHGVPMGGELEYVDGGTLARALSGRLSL